MFDRLLCIYQGYSCRNNGRDENHRNESPWNAFCIKLLFVLQVACFYYMVAFFHCLFFHLKINTKKKRVKVIITQEKRSLCTQNAVLYLDQMLISMFKICFLRIYTVLMKKFSCIPYTLVCFTDKMTTEKNTEMVLDKTSCYSICWSSVDSRCIYYISPL